MISQYKRHSLILGKIANNRKILITLNEIC